LGYQQNICNGYARKYEDSYAIAEEFREWILHIGEKNENLKDSVLNFPKELKNLLDQKVND